MTEDKPEGSHLRTLARSHRQARSRRQSSIASACYRLHPYRSATGIITIELQATCQASIVIGYYPVRSLTVDYIMNALEHSRRLPFFFIHPVLCLWSEWPPGP